MSRAELLEHRFRLFRSLAWAKRHGLAGTVTDIRAELCLVAMELAR